MEQRKSSRNELKKRKTKNETERKPYSTKKSYREEKPPVPQEHTGKISIPTEFLLPNCTKTVQDNLQPKLVVQEMNMKSDYQKYKGLQNQHFTNFEQNDGAETYSIFKEPVRDSLCKYMVQDPVSNHGIDINKNNLDIPQNWEFLKHCSIPKIEPEEIALTKILNEWLRECVSERYYLNSGIIKKAAEQITQILNFKTFSVNKFWIKNFLTNYSLKKFDLTDDFDPCLFSLIHVKVEDIIIKIQATLPTEIVGNFIKMNTNANTNIFMNNNNNINKPKATITNTDRTCTITSSDATLNIKKIQTIFQADYGVMKRCENKTKLNHTITKNDEVSKFKITPESNEKEKIKDEPAKDGSEKEEKIKRELAAKDDEAEKEGLLKTLEDAIEYLKPLQFYALLTSNYRAINFLTTYENVISIKDPPRKPNNVKITFLGRELKPNIPK